VLGDGKIKNVKPQNIAKLNFPLTLSAEYGVTFKNAFPVVAGFLTKIIDDDTIFTDIAEQIFIETISAFPTEKNRKFIGQMFLNVCSQIITKKRTASMIDQQSKILKDKIERLSQATEIWKASDLL
jgi:GMP synthase PP-ATPase subunit